MNIVGRVVVYMFRCRVYHCLSLLLLWTIILCNWYAAYVC